MESSSTELRPIPALERLREELGRSARPRPLSDDRFDRAHELFERSSDQQAGILRWLAALGRTIDAGPAPLRLLSVGCGSGLLDLPLIAALADCRGALEYTGVEPNPAACRRFSDGFRSAPHPDVRLELCNHTVELLGGDRRYDLILAIHSLYYVADPAESIASLLARLSPGGRLVIVQAPRGELNRLADCFWTRPEGDAIWYADRLERHLATRRLRYRVHPLPGRIDVSRCFVAGCPRGALILDFITQVDGRDLDNPVRRPCLDYLGQIGRRDGPRLLAPHPADAYVIEPSLRPDPAPGGFLPPTRAMVPGSLVQEG